MAPPWAVVVFHGNAMALPLAPLAMPWPCLVTDMGARAISWAFMNVDGLSWTFTAVPCHCMGGSACHLNGFHAVFVDFHGLSWPYRGTDMGAHDLSWAFMRFS